jgi:hypothetical protein
LFFVRAGPARRGWHHSGADAHTWQDYRLQQYPGGDDPEHDNDFKHGQFLISVT